MTAENHFLARLDAADFDRLKDALVFLDLERDRELAREHEPVSDVYFPIDCILSVVVVMKDGRQIESRTIGRESGFGLLNALGAQVAFERVLAQTPGRAYRLPADVLRRAVEESPRLLDAVIRHAQATVLQAAQSTACNALHDVEGRMCRWLLMTQDRLQSSVLPLKQEHLSIMLGVQRTTVTAVAQELQEDGLIAYSRGRIQVLDRDGLLAHACECYAAIEEGAAIIFRAQAAE